MSGEHTHEPEGSNERVERETWRRIETVPRDMEVRLWGSVEGKGSLREVAAFPTGVDEWRETYTGKAVLSPTHWRPKAKGPT